MPKITPKETLNTPANMSPDLRAVIEGLHRRILELERAVKEIQAKSGTK